MQNFREDFTFEIRSLLQSAEIDSLLYKLKIDKLRHSQAEAIEHLLQQKNCLVITPTGSGKSLIYILYSQMQSGLTLIISPLIALMNDQVQQLQRLGLSAACLHSELNDTEQTKIQNLMSQNNLKLLFVSPEKFNKKNFRSWLKSFEVSMIVIDEAHCISHWGYGFRPDYRFLGKNLADDFAHTQKLALTATATTATVKDICWHLGLESPHIIKQNPIKEDLEVQITRCSTTNEQYLHLVNLLRLHTNQKGVIFVATLNDLKSLQSKLQFALQSKVVGYHGKLDRKQRQISIERFVNDDFNIMIATKAFSLGVNLNEIDFVVHYSVPESIEAYTQEIGRVGRKGQRTYSYLVYTTKDIAIRKFLINKNFPEEKFVNTFLDFAFRLNPQENEIPLSPLKEYFVNQHSKNDLKQLDSVLQLLDREGLCKLWSNAEEEEVLELSPELYSYEDFLQTYQVRKKIVHTQLENVLEFLDSWEPQPFLKNYYEQTK